MQGFSDVKISWRDKEFTIPANNTLMLIAQIEGILSGGTNEQAISVLLRPGGPPYSALAASFGAAIRWAGGEVTDEEIYISMQDDMAKGGTDALAAINGSVIALLSIMSPPLASKLTEGETEKKTKAAKD